MTRSMSARIALMLLAGVFSCFPVSPGATEPRGDAAEGLAAINVERLLEDLGSDQFETREAATRALEALDDEPIGLRKGLKSPDLEMRRRVDRILKSYIPKRARRGLAKARVLAKEGRVDEMIERLVLWNEWDQGKERGKAVAELAARSAEWEHHNFGHTSFFSLHPHLIFLKRHSPIEPATREELAEMWTRYSELRGNNIVDLRKLQREIQCTVLVASENVHIPGPEYGVIVAGGNILIGGAVHAIILCDGDFKATARLCDCLIIAKGEVVCPPEVTLCTIISGGDTVVLKDTKLQSSAVLSMDNRKSFVKFFDPEAVGLTVWQSYRNGKTWPDGGRWVDDQGKPDFGDGVWIKEVRKDTPFASGLRAEDVITAINEIKVPTKEIFRKVLRRKLAEGGPTLTFTVRRSGKTLDVPIAMKE